MEFSADCEYLATGGQDWILRIWEILHPDNDADYLILMNPEPFKEFKQHTKDIIDISWHTTKQNFVLTASHDKRVILWNIDNMMPSQIYTHSDIVTSVWFKPDADIFATGSFDKNLRFWSIKHRRVINWIDQRSIVSAVQFSTDGERLVSGNMNGEWFIFDTKKNNLDHLSTIKTKKMLVRIY
jgi:WD40 repeat protein